MREYTGNYLRAGGQEEFSRYYAVRDEHACFHPELQRNLVFAQHNLASDHSFNEFTVIVCRNVMIYFDRQLQERVFGLFHSSLVRLGVLGLGRKESLRFSGFENCYDELDPSERLYRRVR